MLQILDAMETQVLLLSFQGGWKTHWSSEGRNDGAWSISCSENAVEASQNPSFESLWTIFSHF